MKHKKCKQFRLEILLAELTHHYCVFKNILKLGSISTQCLFTDKISCMIYHHDHGVTTFNTFNTTINIIQII